MRFVRPGSWLSPRSRNAPHDGFRWWIVSNVVCGLCGTRNLFTQSDAPWHLWDNESGIYIRSGGTLDDMWKHFRKFTKVQDEQGKWFYFRFWEVGTIEWYLRLQDKSEAAIDRFFRCAVSMIIVGVQRCTVFQLHHPVPLNTKRAINVLDNTCRAALEKSHLHKVSNDVFSRLNETFEASFKGQDQDMILKVVTRCVARMFDYGFHESRHFEYFAAWELFYGSNFEQNDVRGYLWSICQSSEIELARFSKFRKRMAQIEANPSELRQA